MILAKSRVGYIASPPIKYKTKDADDLMFLEVAICGKAECLVTGNRVDYPLKVKELEILNPKDFISKHSQ